MSTVGIPTVGRSSVIGSLWLIWSVKELTLYSSSIILRFDLTNSPRIVSIHEINSGIIELQNHENSNGVVNIANIQHWV